MANHKSAEKRVRQSLRKQSYNLRTKKTVRTLEKKLRAVMQAGNSDEAATLLRAFNRKINQAAKKGVVHANKAARKVGRLSRQIQAMTTKA